MYTHPATRWTQFMTLGIPQGLLEECDDAFLCASFGFADGVHGSCQLSVRFFCENLSVISFRSHD